MFYGQDSTLPKHMVELGRIGYISKDRTIKGKKFVSDTAIKCIMCGYANNHSRDCYRLLNAKTKKIMQTRNVKWSEWDPTKPGDDIKIESFKAKNEDNDDDDYDINHRKYFGRGEDDNSSDDDEMPELEVQNDEEDSSSDESFLNVEVPDVVSRRMVTVDWSDSEDKQQQPPQPPQQNPIQGAATTPVQRRAHAVPRTCLLYTSPSPRDGLLSRMPSSA